ncbi:MAG TPA: hypothetical protein VM032_01510 [Vicinamibacterales bacterium]|nr:hypothetical protein [Vicinamibacterales bacterium]
MKHFVVSDLHLGMGRDQTGALHPLEDFHSDAEFERLLDLVLDARGDVIINGDWLDFLQVEPFTVRDSIGVFLSADGIPLAYTAAEALEKLDTLFARQARHFDALASFIAAGGRLTIVQGNHDADLFFPADAGGEPPLQARIRQRLGRADGAALRFVEQSMRLGTVHIEHGHQRCEHVNEFQRHPDIFHPDRTTALLGTPRMELLWGSRLVMEFFNDLEVEYPFADNLKPMTRALWLGIRNGWVDGRTAGAFVRFFLGAGVPWHDVPEVLSPESDAPAVVLQRLDDPALRNLLFQRMGRDEEFQRELTETLRRAPVEEKRQWRSSDRSATGREEVVAQGEQGVAGAIREAREFREAGALLEQPGVSAVLFGHTHAAIDGNAADAKLRGYFNTGTWIPALDIENPAIKRRLKTEEFPVQLLKDRSIFVRRLTYAEITETGGSYAVELKDLT